MEQTEQAGFAIGLKPEMRAAMENLVESGLDWRIALLQLTLWVEPVFVDLLDDEQPEQPEENEPEQPTEQISQE